MGAFNEVFTRITCPQCGTFIECQVQFKYASVWQYQYHIGDELQWEGKYKRYLVGRPEYHLVVADGISHCKECDKFIDFEVWIEDNTITKVCVSSGQYEAEFYDKFFVVVEE